MLGRLLVGLRRGRRRGHQVLSKVGKLPCPLFDMDNVAESKCNDGHIPLSVIRKAVADHPTARRAHNDARGLYQIEMHMNQINNMVMPDDKGAMAALVAALVAAHAAASTTQAMEKADKAVEYARRMDGRTYVSSATEASLWTGRPSARASP